MRLTITAAQLRSAVLDEVTTPGPLELQLWQILCSVKDQTRGKSVFIHCEFDPSVGGIALECTRPSWWGRLCWWLSPGRLRLGV